MGKFAARIALSYVRHIRFKRIEGLMAVAKRE